MKYTHPHFFIFHNIPICHFQRESPSRSWQFCPPKVLQLLDSHAESDRVHPNDDSFVGQVQRLFSFFSLLWFVCLLLSFYYYFLVYFLFARPENSTQFWHLYLFQRAPVLSPRCVLSYNRWTREGGQNETMDGYGLRRRVETEAGGIVGYLI